jgi:hypothetical protein
MKKYKKPFLPVDISVEISNHPHGRQEILLRRLPVPAILEGREYQRYCIIRPRGFEDEILYHHHERGYEALLSVVFTTLAEAALQRRTPTNPAKRLAAV